MAITADRIGHKHLLINRVKIKRAKKVLKAGTEPEMNERALDAVIAEDKRNRLAWEATERFFKSGITIRDVYGKRELRSI